MKLIAFGAALLSFAQIAFASGGQCPAGVPAGVSSCFYADSVKGSDTNSGTSEAAPWQHVPGMTNCAGTCASTTPAPGNGFILKGGSVWHYSASSPVGLPWTWTWSGSSSAPIYIGVDIGWYNGSAWSRPILTMDNPPSSSLVASCTYDDSTKQAVVLKGSYITFDNLEFTGKCWSGSPFAGSLNISGATHSLIERNYFHGWSTTASSIDTHYMILGLTSNTATYNEIAYNVIDGSDSFHGTTTAACVNTTFNGPPCQSGFGVYGDGYNFHHNILRYLSNGIVSNNYYTVHDNLFEYMWNSYDGKSHPNVFESGAAGLIGVPFYFYNNVIRYTHQNVTFWPMFDSVAYEFNNVFYQNDDGAGGTNVNCFMQSPAASSSHPTAYIYNNTFVADDQACAIRFFSGNSATPAWNGIANFENNHFIGSATSISSLISCASPASCQINDYGHEVFQSVSAANTQGYSLANMYQPASSSGATVSAGANLTSSCSSFSSDKALCSGTSGAVSEAAGNVATYPAISLRTRPSTGAWDSGAYQFSSTASTSTTTGPPPPTGLTATPQ